MTSAIYIALFVLFCMLASCGKGYSTHKEIGRKNNIVQIAATFIEVTKIEYSKENSDAGEKWNIKVELSNNSIDKKMCITSVITGCGCMRTRYDKNVVWPSDKVNLEVVYTPGYDSIHFSKLLMVLFNDGKYYKIIRLNG